MSGAPPLEEDAGWTRPSTRDRCSGSAGPCRPRPRAPSSASHTACSRQSPSEWPSRPRGGRCGRRRARAGGPPPGGARRSRARRGRAVTPCPGRWPASSSAQPRSSGVVILRLRGEPAHGGHAPAQALHRHRLVGDGDPVARGLVERLASSARRKPCGVCAAASSERSRVSCTHAVAHALDGVDERQHGDGGARLGRGAHDGLDQRGLDQRPRRVVHEHDAVEAVGQRASAPRAPSPAASRRPPPPPSACGAGPGARARRVDRRRGTTATIASTEGAASKAARRAQEKGLARRGRGRPWAGRRPCARRARPRRGWPRSSVTRSEQPIRARGRASIDLGHGRAEDAGKADRTARRPRRARPATPTPR